MKCIFCGNKGKTSKGKDKINVLEGGVIGRSFICNECVIELFDTLIHQIKPKSKIVKELGKEVCNALDELFIG